MTQYSVIADDLTGAGDTGVQFSKAGLRTRILLENWEPAHLEGAKVVVAQTDSRAMSSEEAYKTVFQAANRLSLAGAAPLYKKIDSTMRGQVGAEIDAVMDVWSIPLSLVCPAFPANGRTIVGGYLLVNGELVSRTAIGVDPVTPVTESHIPTLLAGQSKRGVRGVYSQDLNQGGEHMRNLFRTILAEGGGIIVVDATGEADLALMENAMAEACPEALYVGSAGLALPLASRLARNISSRRSVLSVVGSVNPVSRGQLKLLQQEQTGMFLITADELLADEDAWAVILEERSKALSRLLDQGQDTAVATPGNREEVDQLLARGKIKGLPQRTLTARIAMRTTQVAFEALRKLGDRATADTSGKPPGALVDGLILTGGDIAQAMLDHLDATGINLISEVSPGIPMGALEGAGAEGLKIITKAGGFGAPDALVKAARLLHESR